MIAANLLCTIVGAMLLLNQSKKRRKFTCEASLNIFAALLRAIIVFRRITLGRESQLTPTTSRKNAQKILAAFAAGKDPTVEKTRKKIRGVTLREVLEHYLTVRHIKPNTQKAYRNIIPRCLGDWVDKPVTAITREMVEQRHLDLRKTTRQGTSGEAQANHVMRILGTSETALFESWSC